MLLHAGLLLAAVTAVASRRGGCTLVVLTLACAAAPGVASAQRHPAGDGARSLKHDLQIDLGRLAAGIGPARARAAAGPPVDVLALLERVRATDLLIEDAHREQEAALTRHGASGIVLERHRQAVAQYREALDRLYAAAAALEDPARLRDAAAVGRALEEMARALAGSVDDADRRPLGVTLPYRPLALPQVEPGFEAAITPAYLTAPPPAPAGADLAETPETGLTPAIRARAEALGRDPIAIFEFVHNEIRTDFYYGAMKGATETLRQGSGNDTDQASLLIALLRAAGVPARYVRGVIALPGAQALAWTGVGSTRRAADAFTRAGIPFRPIRQGGSIGAFEVEHTWVEAYVPYSNYRGVRLGSIGQAWIPLDPSMKALDVAPGEDVLAASGFDADAVVAEYLAEPRAESPLDFYRARIAAYLDANRPDLTFDQVLAAVAIRPVRSGLLPGTLPYATVSINEEAPSLADALRHTVRFVAGGEDGASFDVTVPAAELAGRRLTLSYVPASVEDQIAVNAFLGLDNTPAYLVKLRPVLKVGGVVRGAGATPVQMGAFHSFSVELRTPRGVVPIANSVVAGGYYAIGLGSHAASYEAPGTRAPDDTEHASADRLYGLAAAYLERWNEAERLLSRLLRVVNVRPVLSQVIVGAVFRRTLLFGQPQAIEWRGVFVDADLRVSEPVPMGADDGRARAFLRLGGLAGSQAEAGVLQQALQVDAVSADRVIQLAHEQGVPVEAIDQANVASVLPLIETAAIVRAEIADAVNQGFQVTVPRRDLTRHIWSGIGYVVTDPATGAGGYFLSGSLAGGSSTESPEDWVEEQLAEELGSPYSAEPNTDPNAVRFLHKVTVTDQQTGIVGETLERELAVWARDGDGRPVDGALVRFSVEDGGGTFGGSATATAVTNYLGIARVAFTLGTTTSQLPFYLRLSPEDLHLTQVGQNIVSASAEGVDGEGVQTVLLDAPFQHFAHPGPPVRLAKVLGDNAEAPTGTAGGSLLVRAEDEHANPVSNVPIQFTVLPAVMIAPLGAEEPLPPGGVNLTIYPLDPPCPVPTPVLGDCGGRSQVTELTSISGAAVNTILGNTLSTRYQVAADATGTPLPRQIFALRTSTFRGLGIGPFTPHLVMTRVNLVGDQGQPLNSAPSGAELSKPLEVLLYVLEEDYVLEEIPGAFPGCLEPPPPGEPPRDCYRARSLLTSRIRLVDINRPGTVSYPGRDGAVVQGDRSQETATVTFSPVEGGGTATPPVNAVTGRYATRLTLGTAPALNRVEVAAAATIWSPCFDFHGGTVGVRLARLSAGQFVHGDFMRCSDDVTIGDTPPETVTHDVFGVRASISEASVPVTAGGATSRTVRIPYAIAPDAYVAASADVDLFRREADGADTWLGYLPGSRVSGSEGTGTLLAGVPFEAGQEHSTQLVLNRGTDVEIRSEMARLVLQLPAQLRTLRGQRITTRLDRVNQTVCPAGGSLAFELSRSARVTIVLDGEVLVTGGETGPVTWQDVELPGGVHELPISPDAVTSGAHPYTVTAVFERAGLETVSATAVGEVVHDVIIDAFLPIGHTIVKGVDVSDGHISLTREDLSIPGHGPQLHFLRSYSSAGQRSTGAMGAGWSHNYEARIVQDSCGTVSLVGGEGSGIKFSQISPGVFRPHAGYHGRLTYAAATNSWDFVTKQNVRHHYDPAIGDGSAVIHRLAYIEDANGNRLTLAYDPAPPFNLRTVTDASGRTLTLTYELLAAQVPQLVEHRLTRIDGPLDLLVQYSYDQFGNLKTATRASRSESYAYTDTDARDRHNLTRFTGPNGDVMEVTWFTDADTIPGESPTQLFPEKWEFVRTVTWGAGTPDAAASRFSYDYSSASAPVTTVVDARDVPTEYVMHPQFGAVLETRVLVPGGPNVTRTRWAFQDGIDDVFITSTTDPNGRVTSYTYDANGNPETETIHANTVPYAPVTDSAGGPQDRVITRSDYDSVFGRVTRQVDAEGRETVYELDPATGNVLSVTTQPGGGVDPVVTRYSYRNVGALKGVLHTTTDPLDRVTTYDEYDEFGNATRVVDPAGNITSYVYDARSRLREVRDTRGHRTTFEYDDLDRQELTTRHTGAQPADVAMASAERRTATTYFPGGQPRTVTNGLGHVTSYAYDALNRQIEQTDVVQDADGTSVTIRVQTAWDGNGNRVRQVDGRGIVHEFVHDPLNRLVETRVDGRVVATATYDAAGNRLTDTDLHGHVTRTEYDGLYRPARTILPIPTYSRRTRYDLVGNVLESIDANGHSTFNTYDGLDRLTSTRNALGHVKRITHDAAGNRVLEEDVASGLRVRYLGHDGLNRPAEMRQEFTDPLTGAPVVYTTAYSYLDAENVTITTSPRGIVTRERFNGHDALIERVVDAAGLQLRTTYRYDGNGNVTGEKDAEGNVVDRAVAYDGLNRRILASYPLGGEERWYYDGNGNAVRSVDLRGIVSLSTFDHLNRKTSDAIVESISNGGSELALSTVTYDDAANVTVARDANNNATRQEDDAMHRPIRLVDALDQASRSEWDGENRTAQIDKRGKRTEFTYDALNRLVETRRSTTGGAHVTTVEYLDAQQQRIDTNPGGVATVMQFDALQRPRRTSKRHAGLAEPYGAAEILLEEREFDPHGNTVRLSDTNGNVTRYEFDGADRQVRVVEGAGSPVEASTSFTYDRAGNLLTVKDGRSHGRPFDARHTYDVRSRRVLSENGAGEVTAFTWDQGGNLLSVTEPKGGSHVTRYAYDEAGKLLAVDETRGGAGGITRYQYDANRNLIAQQDAHGNLTTWRYDTLNRQTGSFQHTVAGLLADGRPRTAGAGGDEATALRWHYEYDENDNQALVVDAEGQRVVKRYDDLGRLDLKTYENHRPGPGGVPVRPTLLSVAYTYDANGNLRRTDETKQLESGAAVETCVMEYDPLDRLVLKTNFDGKQLRFAYDRGGNQTSVIDADSLATTYTFDARNRMASAADGPTTTHYAYWPDGLQRTVTYPNGIASEMEYDAADRVTQILNHGGDRASPISQFEYSYDANGNRSSQVERHARLNGGAAQQTTYQYDALNRLTGVDFPGAAGMTYAYAPNGNRTAENGVAAGSDSATARAYTYNRHNQLTSITDLVNPAESVVLRYDRNGNTTEQKVGAIDPGTGDVPAPTATKAFGWDIRDQLASAAGGAAAVSFDYDYAGRRVKMVSPAAHIRYLHDADGVLQEYDGGSFATTLRYTYGPAGLLSLDARPAGGRTFYLRDALGSTSELVDTAGTTQASFSYDPWGKVVFGFDTTPNRRRFTGHYFDSETGLHFFGARYYDERIGRFLSQDQYLGESETPATLHRYQYALGNPLRYVDPTGYASEPVNNPFPTGNPCHGSTGACNPATKEVDDYVDAVNEVYLARARAEGEALAEMVGTPGGPDPETGAHRPPTGMYATRASIYRKLNQWQREDQAFQTAERERLLARLERDGDTLTTRLDILLEDAVENDPGSLSTKLAATFVSTTYALLPGIAAGDLTRKLQTGHETTMWDWVGAAGDAMTLLGPVTKVTGGVRQTLQRVAPSIGATRSQVAAIQAVAREEGVEIAVRSTNVVTAGVSKLLTWLKVPAKPEAVKAKSIYGIAFGEVGTRSKAASAVTRAWEWLGIYRSDLDLAWVRRVADGSLLDNAATRRIGELINRRSGIRSFRHGSHATAGPAGRGPLSAEQLAKIGEPGGAIAYTADAAETLGAARTRDLFTEWGRYHPDWGPVGPESLFQTAAPSGAVMSAHRIATGKERNDK